MPRKERKRSTEEIENKYESSESDSEYDSEGSDDDSASGSDDEMMEKKVSQPQLTEEKVDLDTLPLSPRMKTIIQNGYKVDIVTFEHNGALLSPSSEKGKDLKVELKPIEGLSKDLTEIQMISFVSCTNEYGVDIKLTNNGFPGINEGKICSHIRGGSRGDYIAGAFSKDKSQEPLPVYVQTKRTKSRFLSEHGSISYGEAISGFVPVKNSYIAEHGSVALDFLTKEMKHPVSDKDSVVVISKEIGEAAISQLKKQFENRNVCSLADLTVTAERAFVPKGKESCAWNDRTEVDQRYIAGPYANQESLKKRKEEIFNLPGRLTYKLEVIHKPLLG